ncbi:TOBE domain-containing protein [Aquabacterium sp.]|uniref:TOBE domain-containing protein n=1 Tax=Aquabacterium sp. TaxID=1872578 RepID=UPI002B8AB618|nr:TOBE domain-containing protein [Aquabacterium sp.]HSW08557.1 TOBE domain-containing protein [Aquabacterium sp.]
MNEATLVSGELKLAGRLDARFFALLEAIAATGSINRAARTAGYSYRGAWLLLETAANLASEPLLASVTGGAQGGGSRLTPTALALLDAWHQLQGAHHEFLQRQEAWLLAQPALAGALRRLSMKTTARNQFAGTLTAIELGPVTAQATITLRGGQEITATMTSSAAKRMKLKQGREAIALVKSSAIVLVTDFAGYQLSARNQLAGTISRLEKGAVSSLVGVTLPGGSVITASVTNDAVDALSLAVGQAATAVFKAYSVMVAVSE